MKKDFACAQEKYNELLKQVDDPTELRDGRYLLQFLKEGLSPIQIEYIVDLKPTTIEKRVTDYLLSKEENEEDFLYLLEVSGFPRLSRFKRYLNFSGTNDSGFCKLENYNGSNLKELIKYYSQIPVYNKMLEEKAQERAQIKNKGGYIIKHSRYGAVRSDLNRLMASVKF